MEDPNALAADCIVISCCCQCMILQILIFVLLKLPCKLFKKTKRYAKKLRTRKKGTKIMVVELRRYEEDSFRHDMESFRTDFKDHVLDEEPVNCCMDEIERVFEDFSSNGKFAFGSFWGGNVSSRGFRSCVMESELDYEDVRYHLNCLARSVSTNILSNSSIICPQTDDYSKSGN